MAGNIIELHTEVPAELEANVFGQFDEHLKLIERTLNVTVISRDGILKILGNEQNAASAKKLIEELTVLAKKRQYDHETECQLCSFSGNGAEKRSSHGNRQRFYL
jgi:Phosphate starvation-inducible protein PhoH, predicted ATPase